MKPLIKSKYFRRIGDGQTCRDCLIPTEAYERYKTSQETLDRAYYFTRYDVCRDCGKMYMIDSSRVIGKNVKKPLKETKRIQFIKPRAISQKKPPVLSVQIPIVEVPKIKPAEVLPYKGNPTLEIRNYCLRLLTEHGHSYESAQRILKSVSFP